VENDEDSTVKVKLAFREASKGSVPFPLKDWPDTPTQPGVSTLFAMSPHVSGLLRDVATQIRKFFWPVFLKLLGWDYELQALFWRSGPRLHGAWLLLHATNDK